MKRCLFVTLLAVLVLCASASAQSQGNNGHHSSSIWFPEATFGGMFEKHDSSSPFFSFKSDFGMKATVWKKGRNSTFFEFMFQTVGADMVNQKVNISGNAYLLGVGWELDLGETKIAGGIVHLSTHKAEDLGRLVQRKEFRSRALSEGTLDTADLNVFYGEVGHTFNRLPLRPRVRVRVQPLGFQFRGGVAKFRQPVYLATSANLWRGEEKRVTIGSTHEWGEGEPLNSLSVHFHLFERGQNEGRFQPFVRWVGGNKTSVSPVEGWNHGGTAVGVRLSFTAK